MNFYRQDGFDSTPRKYTAKGEAGNYAKLVNNMSRTRSRIYELSICNNWEWYVTFTLDSSKYDRSNLKQFIKDLSQFIRDYRKKTNNQVKYLLIPEKHKDGSWHMHGLLMEIPSDELYPFSITEHLPYSILEKLQNGRQVYTWKNYEHKFGYASIEPILNHEAVSQYITKYITKEMMNTITELNAHSYYSSKGLNSSVVKKRDILCKEIQDPHYSNDYVSIKWFDNYNEALTCFEGAVI